jgi:multisubunit Na+/H+ antiporter MnhE subunit
MFYKIAIILAILWLLGVVTSYTMGGLIHALLLAAIVMVVVNLVTGRKPAVVRKDNAQDVY